ncbi:hypothetical protein PSYPI_02252 [Pseudomonas syringae pv. pisi str. 1704B]|uniref:Uncharacterized protein n=1 Tax=Pseudomonas syringae pv. pisi str. 1704B TaxID=629263 RepID=F3G2J6_PSESJ|nr:hypothetical protein PSYPI_02252 [Pseudomonas syringae pv. pisi str. 1704B]
MFRIDSNKTTVVKLTQKVWCVKARFDSRPFEIMLARRQQLIALQFEREGLGCNLNYTRVKIEHKTDVSLQSAFKAQITSRALHRFNHECTTTAPHSACNVSGDLGTIDISDHVLAPVLNVKFYSAQEKVNKT